MQACVLDLSCFEQRDSRQESQQKDSFVIANPGISNSVSNETLILMFRVILEKRVIATIDKFLLEKRVVTTIHEDFFATHTHTGRHRHFSFSHIPTLREQRGHT